MSQVSSISKLGRGSQLGVRSGLKSPSRTAPAGTVGRGEGGRWSKGLEGQEATISQWTRGSDLLQKATVAAVSPIPSGDRERDILQSFQTKAGGFSENISTVTQKQVCVASSFYRPCAGSLAWYLTYELPFQGPGSK